MSGFLFPFLRPMLASLIDSPFERAGWSYELKWDGIRTLVYLEGDRLALYSRNGHNITGAYPDLVGLMERRARRRDSLTVLDGEIVALDERGLPNFQRLQSRLWLRNERWVREASRIVPVTFVAFDLLVHQGELLLDRPLHERRALMDEAVREGGPLAISRGFGPDGRELLERARERGMEGVVAKRLDSIYRPGKRSSDWLKIKIRNRQDCVALGWTEGEQPMGFGSLIAGVAEGEIWRYAGRVGSGFAAESIARLMPVLRRLETPHLPVRGLPPSLGPVHWLQPDLVFEVEFQEWTREGHLRAPVFQGLRFDKDPRDCRMDLPLAVGRMGL